MKDIDYENFESSMSWMKNSLRFFDTKFMDSIMKQPEGGSHAHGSVHISFVREMQNSEAAAASKKPPLPPNAPTTRSMFRNFNELNLE